MLTMKYPKGFLKAKNRAIAQGFEDIEECYGGITQYEQFYNCSECPLNGFCESESKFIEEELPYYDD